MMALDRPTTRSAPRMPVGRSAYMNAKGYALWTSIIKPVLLSRFNGG